MGKWCLVCGIWEKPKVACKIQWVALIDIKEEMSIFVMSCFPGKSLEGGLEHLGRWKQVGTLEGWLVLQSFSDSLRPYLSMGHFTVLFYMGFTSWSLYLLPFLCPLDTLFMYLISLGDFFTHSFNIFMLFNLVFIVYCIVNILVYFLSCKNI